MLGKFFALINRACVQAMRERFEQSDLCLADGLRCFERNVENN
jgi:hypothetical protein